MAKSLWKILIKTLHMNNIAENCTIHEIKINASNNPLKRLIPYYRFRAEAIKILKKLNPAVIHSQMIDMLKIAIKYNSHKKQKAQLIYEIADLHRFLVDKQSSPIKKVIQIYLRKEDIRCCKKISLLIITSNKYYDRNNEKVGINICYKSDKQI